MIFCATPAYLQWLKYKETRKERDDHSSEPGQYELISESYSIGPEEES